MKFRKKAVISLPQRQDSGPIAQFVEEELRSDGALGMDCRDIYTFFPPHYQASSKALWLSMSLCRK